MPLDFVVTAIADGRPVDWHALQQIARGEDESQLLAQLEVIDHVAQYYRDRRREEEDRVPEGPALR